MLLAAQRPLFTLTGPVVAGIGPGQVSVADFCCWDISFVCGALGRNFSSAAFSAFLQRLPAYGNLSSGISSWAREFGSSILLPANCSALHRTRLQSQTHTSLLRCSSRDDEQWQSQTKAVFQTSLSSRANRSLDESAHRPQEKEF
jgi:hypothetical protein